MRRCSLTALFVLILAGSPVRAGFLGWSYSWTASPGTPTPVTNPNGNLQLFSVSGGNTQLSESVLAAVITVPSATDATPINSYPYQLSLTLTDLASNDQGTLNFYGTLSGSFANLSNSYTDPTSQQVLIGTNNYTVTLGAYNAPTSFFPGVITATITATPEVQPVPEPASMALLACALPGLAIVTWRRRR